MKLAWVVLLLPVALSGKRPLTHEAMWAMKRVGAPSLSPNGKWAVFQVTEPSYEEKAQVSDLWIVPADGSAKPRRLTSSKGGESGVTWSADSRKIAFSSKRDSEESAEIYLLDLAAGGEAVRVTSLSKGASNPKFSPDGKRLLFESAVYPGAMSEDDNKRIAGERKARRYNARVYESFPVRFWDRWLDDTHPHIFVQSLEPAGPAKDLLAHSTLAAGKGFGGVQIASGETLFAEWAPDGNSIVFTATANRNQSAFAEVKPALYRAPAVGGEAELISNGRGNFSKPLFRPDGKALYCLYSDEEGKVYGIERIAMFAWPRTGDPVVVTKNFDRSVGGFGFTSDSKMIYLTSEDSGHENLLRVPSPGGAVEPVIVPKTGVYSGLAVAGASSNPVLVGNWESAANPMELVRMDAEAKRHRPLSDFNSAEAAEYDLPPLREFWFKASTGRNVHSYVALPAAFDEHKKYPLVILIHGGPHAMYRDQFVLRWNYHLISNTRYVVLLTDYVGSTGYGEKFAQDIQGDPLKGPGIELNEAADEAVKQFAFIDGTRMAAGGASYGGHLANWLEATTTRYKCIFSHAGLVNLESQWGTSDTIYGREVTNGGPVWEQGPVWREQNPIRHAKNFQTPILLSVGERDFRVPMNNTLENWSVLQRLQVPSKLLVFPNANHWILNGEDSRFFYGELLGWLAKYLGS